MAYEMIGWRLANGEIHLLKADATHHPGQEGELLKYDPATTPDGLPPAGCCCLTAGCCEFPTSDDIPGSVTVQISGCGCLSGSYNLPKVGDGFDNTGVWADNFSKCDGTLLMTLQCQGQVLCLDPEPVYTLTITHSEANVSVEINFVNVSCDPFHLLSTSKCLHDPLTNCGDVASIPCDCIDSLSAEVTE